MTSRHRIDLITASIKQNKSKNIDGSVLVAATIFARSYAHEADVFYVQGRCRARRTVRHKIEFDEALAVAASFFCFGLAYYAANRSREARRECARRLAAERVAKTMAFHDTLTGLPNRPQFDEAVRKALATPPRTGGVHAVLMMDLNGFKRVNDVFGHAIGDEVLMHVGTRLARVVRHGDLVARLGGD